MMPPMTIRPATAADADTLAATVAEGFDSYRAFAPPGWEPPDMALEADPDARAARAIPGRGASWPSVTARRSATSRSWPLARTRWARRSTTASRTSGSCSCGASFWGTGAAQRLLADAVAAAGERGFATMRLFTPEGQTRARRFYEREGWTLHGGAFDGGLGIPLVEYRRALG